MDHLYQSFGMFFEDSGPWTLLPTESYAMGVKSMHLARRDDILSLSLSLFAFTFIQQIEELILNYTDIRDELC